MILYPKIDPVAFSIGSFKIYWYGITYLFGFLGAFALALFRGKGQWTPTLISDLVFYAAVGIILGGRLGFILFYQVSDIWQNPLTTFAFWEPGRSFHGGLIGVLCALCIFSYRYKKKFLEVTDFIAPIVPIGLGFGRLGNFINGELWGRVTDVPWGMIFPHVDLQPRHPSQLYELGLEGIVLCILLLWYAQRPRKIGAISGVFLIFYGIFRCMVELVREPDINLGFIAFDWVTMGHILSAPMIVCGIWLLNRKT